ncbi:MAG: hypothetical protein WCV63_05905 [Negativicutes bacterium]|jgi:hypothetical protein
MMNALSIPEAKDSIVLAKLSESDRKILRITPQAMRNLLNRARKLML